MLNPENKDQSTTTLFHATGAEVLTVDIKTPIHSAKEIVDKYDKFLQEHPNVKVAVLGTVRYTSVRLSQMTYNIIQMSCNRVDLIFIIVLNSG